MKTHTTIGARILSGSRFTILRLAEEIAFNHHERWDGTATPESPAPPFRWPAASSPSPTCSMR